MHPTLENLEQTAAEKPAEVRIFIQRYGGKAKTAEVDVELLYKKKGRGSAPGFIEWEDITDTMPDSVKKMVEYFRDRIAKFMEKIEAEK